MFNDTDLPKSAVENPDTGFDAGAEPSAAAPPVRFGRLALCVATASALAFGVVGTVAYGVWFNRDQQTYADAMAGARQALGTAASAAIGPASAKSMAPPKAAIFAAAPQSVTTTAGAERTASGMHANVAAPVTKATQTTGDTPATAQMQATAAASDGEEGSKQASWSGPVTRLPTPAASQTSIADATPAATAPSVPAAQRAAHPSQQLASSRPGRDARLAQQDRRSSSTANSRHKESLFARMSSFFRRVSYRQHGTGSQQTSYSHP
ncbi:hypothetical protein [Paraburkholderia sp. D1E]|uniref:hypothetical protein n=1 Tax=Paraburkholderia sp. D1E TaxID=3461398 RepID=UPI00404653C7